MQSRYNSLTYACVSAYSSSYQRSAASYSSTKNRMCIDELHEYGDLPDDFSNEMKTNRACIKREHSSEQFFSLDSKNEEAHISV